MKKILLVFTLSICLKSNSQDIVKIKAIDSIVTVINNSNFQSQTDSIIHDVLQINMSIKTYITVMMDDTHIKKYTYKVVSDGQENGRVEKMVSVSNYYFHQDSLIKVEESISETEKKDGHADWYYANDRPLYYTPNLERSEERALFLLTLAKSFLKLTQK